MEIVAIIISVLAFFLSGLQFFSETNRQKKESTLNAYDKLQLEVFKLLKDNNLYAVTREDSEKWVEITTCLAKLESFAIGVNTNIYSLKIVNRLGGGFLIEQYVKLEPIIEEKRKEDSSMKHYDEFQKLIGKLKKGRRNEITI